VCAVLGPPTLRVRQAKTNKGRRVLPLPQPAVDALHAHHTDQTCHAHSTQSAWQDEDLVFPSTIGTPWNLANFRHRFQEACRTAKIGDWVSQYGTYATRFEAALACYWDSQAVAGR
jgi:integrase